MSDTNWFDLVHLIHNTQLFTSLNIGANRASQILRHMNDVELFLGIDISL